MARGPQTPEARAKIAESNRRRRGEKRSEQARANVSAAQRGKPVSEETRQKLVEAWKTRERKPPTQRIFEDFNGYRAKFGYNHPLTTSQGLLYEHREVLYNKIGPGPHECHWNYLTGCGNTALEWGGQRGIVADHLDDDKQNNDPENLVPSCQNCNWNRSNPKMSAKWGRV